MNNPRGSQQRARHTSGSANSGTANTAQGPKLAVAPTRATMPTVVREAALVPLDDEQIAAVESGLAEDSNAAERVVALTTLGVTLVELATTLGVSEATVRGWRAKRHPPSATVGQGLDDLRYLASFLWSRGIHAERLVSWLRSASPELADDDTRRRPLEVIGEDPVRVLAAARAFALRRGLTPVSNP